MTDPELLPIGAMSRASGLTVSALRFYDAESLLRPASVDPTTGYRRYSPDQVPAARLLAGMRRVQVPLADMAQVLESLDDPETAGSVLRSHLQRLETAVEDARREVDRLCDLLRPAPATWTVPAADLLRALGQVRYAVSTDPDLPALAGVLLEGGEHGVRAVATDRYRLVAAVVAERPVVPGRALLPASSVDVLLAELSDVDTDVRLRLGAAENVLRVTHGRGLLEVVVLDLDYPDVTGLLGRRPGGTTLPVTEVIARAEVPEPDVPGRERVRLEDHLAVDRAFLLEAVSGLPDGRVVLPLDGEIGPLLLESDGLTALLMPLGEDR